MKLNNQTEIELLYHFNGADGLKTGYVKASGWGLAGSAKRK